MAEAEPAYGLEAGALAALMPMHLLLGADGGIEAHGATVARLFDGAGLAGRSFFDLFSLRRPSGLTSIAALRARMGQRLHLAPHHRPASVLRGLAVPLADRRRLLLNLSFGIGLIDAVQDHALTDADFAPTDLAVELLYVVEAKSAVMQELKDLNLRLQGAKTAAEEQALTDTLTGLRNRRALAAELERALQQRQDFGLMHIDLDHFKAVNDTHGHAAGDRLLRAVAQVLRSETRAGDTVARIGGDEFVIVLPELADARHLLQIARRINDRLALPPDCGGLALPPDGGGLSLPPGGGGLACRVTASIGLTVSSAYASPTADDLLNDADRALYAAKGAGRACARVHPPACTRRSR